MEILTIEWSLNRSPEVILEAWAVAATIHAVLAVRAQETLVAVPEGG